MCTGSRPSCEDRYPGARLAVHDGGRWGGSRAVWQEANAIVRGRVAHGSDWSGAIVDGHLLLGQPEANRVSWVEPDPDSEQLTDVTVRSWATFRRGFGASVAAAVPAPGEPWDLVVGAPDDDAGRGAVLWYRDALVNGVPAVELTGVSAGDRLGKTVVACPDLSGDGLVDWLISAPRFSAPADEPQSTAASLGGAVVFVASEDIAAMQGTAEVRAAGTVWWAATVGAAAGTAVTCDTDLTGDGVVDVVVGGPGYGAEQAGRVFVLDGADLPASGSLAEAAIVVLTGPTNGGWAGASLASADFDGDGLGDLAVGAPGARAGTGTVLLYDGEDLAGDDRLIAPRTTFDLRDETPGQHLGRTLARGDPDGDGDIDLFVGAPDWVIDKGHDAGRLFVWHGGDKWKATEIAGEDDNRAIEGRQAFQRVGLEIVLGDLDGDGADEIVLPTRSRAAP